MFWELDVDMQCFIVSTYSHYRIPKAALQKKESCWNARTVKRRILWQGDLRDNHQGALPELLNWIEIFKWCLAKYLPSRSPILRQRALSQSSCTISSIVASISPMMIEQMYIGIKI